MKINVPQDDLVCGTTRFPRKCDYIYCYNKWINDANPREIINHNIKNDIEADKRKCIIVYCKTNHITTFFNICKQINKTFILISGSSDYSIDYNLYLKKPNNIVKWYAENVNYKVKNLIPLPLGTVSGTWVGNEKSKAELYNHPKFNLIVPNNNESKKINLVFMCHNISTNAKHRTQVYNYFNNKSWVTNLCQKKLGKRITEIDFLSMVYNHNFIISPFGNGIDCGRTWIAIQLGCIPIMPYHLCFEDWSNNLPIVLYHNITEITEEYLNKKLAEFKKRIFTYDYLKTSYWKARFEKDRQIFN